MLADMQKKVIKSQIVYQLSFILRKYPIGLESITVSLS